MTFGEFYFSNVPLILFSLNMPESGLLQLLDIMRNHSSMAARHLACHLNPNYMEAHMLFPLWLQVYQQVWDIGPILILSSLNLHWNLELIYLLHLTVY